MSETTQPVVTPANGAATPAPAAAANAPDELDQLLKQFETPAETPKAETTATPKVEASDIKDVVEFVRTEKTRKESETVKADIEKARGVIRSQLDEIGVKIPDDILEGTMDALARKDPRIQKAWMQRGTNPRAWDDVVKGIAKKVRQDFESLPDKETTDDKNAVRLAVRSASTRTPEAEAFDSKKVNSMTTAEFNRLKRQLLGG